MNVCMHTYVQNIQQPDTGLRKIFSTKKQPWFLEEVANSACGQEMYKMNLKVHLGQKAEKEQKKVA